METQSTNNFHSGRSKGLGFGILLMAIGILFLGFNFGIISSPLKWVLFSWPMILVAIGIIKLVHRDFFNAAIFLILGSFFLMPKIIDAYPASFPGMEGRFIITYWPILLIAGGILIILNKLYGKPCYKSKCNYSDEVRKNKKYEPTGSFSKNSIFGSGEHIVLEPDFRGGELNAIFGGIILDLRNTNLAEGISQLDINAVFGGITILVPSDWCVETHVDAVFGGFENKRIAKGEVNSERKLIISGACVFGGGEVRS